MNWTSSAPVHPESAQTPLDRAAAAEAMPLGSTTTPQTLAAVLDVHSAAPKPVPSVGSPFVANLSVSTTSKGVL